VLALLARAEGRVVATDDLVAAVWPAEPPQSARASLHSHVSRLRGHLGSGAARLETVGDGYRLILSEDGLDVAHALSLLRRAQEVAVADPAKACDLLTEAGAQWRGTPLSDLSGVPPLAAWTVWLDELRREVAECHVECTLAAGRAGEVVGAAREAVAADPFRERPVLLLMRALAATGRAAEALRQGYDFRRRLSRETGLDPSETLADLEHEIAAGATRRSGVPRFAPPARLIGRTAEVAALQRLLGEGRLVTVVGTGGVGKTSLALEVARSRAAEVLLLAPVTDPAAVPYALADALDLRVTQGDVLTACAALLGSGPKLLIIDNCEHVRTAVRDLVTTLHAGCPELVVLATSREPLGLPAEQQFRLTPLPLPDPGGAGPLDQVPSVAVFLERAGRVHPGARFGPEQLRLISAIVRRLDGVPLAIELAAGRLSSLGLTDLHARLDRSLDLLGDGGRAGDPRHRTLRATIDWSYRLLSDGQQRLFRHLAVFPDGFDLATAERTAATLDLVEDPAGALGHLVDASMVDATLTEPTRYRMLETLRSFGVDRLTAAGELTRAQNLLVDWASDLAAFIGSAEPTDAEPEADLALRRELANLRAAWAMLRRSGRPDDATTFVSDLLMLASVRDLPEIWQWARDLAGDPAVAGHPRRGAVLGMAATAAWQQGELVAADQLAREGLAASDNDEGRWWCLTALSNADLSRGAHAEAIAHAEAAAGLALRPAEHYGIAAIAALYAGDLELARSFHTRLAGIARSPTLRGLHAYVAGEIDNVSGRYAPAEAHYTRAITLARTAGATFIDGIAAVGLVSVQAKAGRIDDALRGYRELIGYWERSGNWLQQWTTLRNLAILLRDLADPEPALFLEAAADHASDAPAVVGAVWTPPPVAAHLPEATAVRVRSDAEAAVPAQVLAVARRAIDAHLVGRGAPAR
jgi:predicted ATPase/DNA-binding SARP family transcriptional activator